MTIVSWPAPDGSRNARQPQPRQRPVEPRDHARDRRHRPAPRAPAGTPPRRSRRAAMAMQAAWMSLTGAPPPFVARRAHVEREPRQPRNHVDRARLDLQPPDGGDEIVLRLARAPRRRGSSRPPPRPRRGAAPSARSRRGRRAPSTVTSIRVAPLIALDHAERQPLGLQHRPLLDMQFDEGGDVARAAGVGALGIAAERGQRLRQRDARRGPAPPSPTAESVPGERARARHRGRRTARPPRRRTRRPRWRDRAARPARASCSTTASAASAPRLPS